jgi:hypothetical protein
VRFKIAERARQAVDEYLRVTQRPPGAFLFGAAARSEAYHTAFARLVSNWVAMIGLDVSLFGTHSLRSENEHAGLAVARVGVLHEPIHSPCGLLASPIHVRAIERSEHRHL